MNTHFKEIFSGKVVNKKLTFNTGMDEFPRYVLEYLIDNYCDEETFEEDFEQVKRRMRENFVHGAVKRHGSKIYSSVHAMFRDLSDGPSDLRFGVEARFNLTAIFSLYGRVIASERVTAGDAVYWRFEVWPTDYIFATFGYGRRYIGDDPFLLEDPDVGRRTTAESVYFVTVRGDF